MLNKIKSYFFKHTTILDRYLFREFFSPFFLAISGFALIGIVDILFYLVERAILSGVPFLVVVQLLLYKLPAIMVLFFPMAVLFAMMLLLVRMAKDSELTVLRTSGVHTLRIIAPLLLFAFSTTFLSYFTNETIVPWTNEKSDLLIQNEITKKPPPDIAENIVFKDGHQRYFYVKRINAKLSSMENILIFEETAQFPRIISAKKALWEQNKWTLLNGFIQETDEGGLISFLDRFEEMTIHVQEDIYSFYKKQKSASEMNSEELKNKIQTLTKGGVSTRSLEVEYYLKTSIPAACFIFGLIGLSYCLSFVRSGKDWWGVVVAICAAVLTVGFYFFIVAVFRALAKDGELSPFLGAWTPNILYASIATGILSYQCKYR